MRRGLVLLVGVVLFASCSSDSTKPAASDPGALVRTTMRSRVGVLLDEIPAADRARAAASILEEPASFWKARAATQLHLTAYRLNFRDSFYGGKQLQLPLPPEPKWTVTIGAAAKRMTYQGHDVVAVPYAFSGTLLTDTASPGVSEPKLANIGGVWREPFNLPIDPEMLVQRTGYDCIDEADFPFNSVDSEEMDSFFDQDTVVEKHLGNIGQSHFSKNGTESCLASLRHHVGRVDTAVTFTRLKWNQSTADEVRYGEDTGKTADLKLFSPEFGPSRVLYRYVHANSCDTVEQSVGGTGWRRLLQFATSDENVGDTDLLIGGVDYNKDGKPQAVDTHNLYEFSPCHQHYHFKYYGDLKLSGTATNVNSKKGFCLQSTARAANRETSPLHNLFGTCHYQGMAPGWIDEYKIGVPGQWIDITSFAPGPATRSFTSNPKGVLCEGTFVDANGKALPAGHDPEWAPTSFKSDTGAVVEAPRCKLKDGWDANNSDKVDEILPPLGQGLITTACTRGQIGPLRNCGFGDNPTIAACAPGQPTTVTFALPPGAAPQVVRLTEYSHALKSAVPARYEDSFVPVAPGVIDAPYMLANAIVTAAAPTSVPFTCPAPRTDGAAEPGGTYALYSAPVLPGDAPATLKTS